MIIELRRRHISMALAMALSSSVAALTPFAEAQASDRPAQIVALTKKAYQTEQRDVEEFKVSTNAAMRLTYARLLARGRIVSDSNPLRAPDMNGAIEVYRGLVSTSDAEVRVKAIGELADLLQRKGGVENEQEATALRASIARPLAGASVQAAPAADTPVNIEEDLRNRMANGSLDAAFDLLLLQARENPTEVDTLRSQMLLMANLSALEGDGAVGRLAGRYAGSFDAQEHPEVLKSLLVLAAGDGSDSLVGVIEKNREALLAVLGQEQTREIVWQLVNGGSTRAAELIALDLVDENVFGFDEADAKWAIEALNGAGSYRANYVTAKLYYQGIYVDKDIDRAVSAMEKMLAGADAARQESLVIADRFARMNLSDSLVAKYVLPIYMGAWKAGDLSVVARLARVIVSAEKGGFYATAADMPIPSDQLVAELSSAYTNGDLSAGMMLGDIYREGRLVAADPTMARTIYEDLRQQYADMPGMQLKLREQLAKLVRQDLEVTRAYAAYHAELRALAEERNLWAMRELGVLLAKGGPEIETDVEGGLNLLLEALSEGYFPAGPNAADIALASGSTDSLRRLSDVFKKFDPRTLSPESKVQLAEVDFALKQFDQAEYLLSDPDVQELPIGQFLLAQVMLSSGKLAPEIAAGKMKDVILAFTGQDGQLIEFIQQLARQDRLSTEFMEPVLERLAKIADKNNMLAINVAFRLRQTWPSSRSLSFNRVVDWSVYYAARGVSEPLARIATNVNEAAVGPEKYRYLVDNVEEVLPAVPNNGSLRMFLAEVYAQGVGRSRDLDRARQFVKEAAELGNLEALNAIASDFHNGRSVGMDRDRAEDLYRALAFVGSNSSALALARNYSKAPSSKVHETRAFAYYIKAAAGGSSSAMVEVGRNYLAGAGVGLDEAEGIAWLEKAADLGSVDAMTQLYFYYFVKNPTSKNDDAEVWLDKLVEANVPEMIIRKVVLLRDRDEAGNREVIFQLLNRAEGMGSQFARRLKNIYLKESRVGE
ncbi:hypothetical protein GVN24_05840 [Rhizobium sp. CRIBSB]|nr:hypothetical protein [Rhizobium sp. CRIBSB]